MSPHIEIISRECKEKIDLKEERGKLPKKPMFYSMLEYPFFQKDIPREEVEKQHKLLMHAATYKHYQCPECIFHIPEDDDSFSMFLDPLIEDGLSKELVQVFQYAFKDEDISYVSIF